MRSEFIPHVKLEGYIMSIYFKSLSIICPTGATLAMGKLTVRIYRGEDFPQLDSRSKLPRKPGIGELDLVDPYCVVSYAGHKARTPVVKNSYDPEWNHEISLPFQVCITVKSGHPSSSGPTWRWPN